MPQLIAAAITAEIPATGATITVLSTATVTVTYATVIANVLIAAGAVYAAQSMMKTPDFSSLERSSVGKMAMSKEATPTRRKIYGTQRVSGPLAFISTTGAKNEDLHMIVLLADHECNGGGTAGHRGLYLNDVLAMDEDGNIQSPFVGKFDSITKLGVTGQTAFDIDSPEWQVDEADRTLDGITSVYCKFIYDPQVVS